MGKRKRERARVAELGAAPVAERHGFDPGGLLGHESTYAVNVTEQVALGVSTVFACVRIIADLVADGSVGEYRGTDRLDESRIVLRPMRSMTRRTWLWLVSATMALYNGCYLRRVGGLDTEGVARSLRPIVPSRLVWQGSVPYLDGERIDPAELVYVPRASWPTVTAELGTVLRLARDAFAAAWSADAYRADFWQAGGAPMLQIVSDQELSATDAEAISDRYVERRTTNPGRPPVFGKGAALQTIGADVAGAGADSALGALGSEVARFFGVPAWLVNVPQSAGSLTYANASAAGLDLVRYTLQPGYAGPIGDAWSDELPGGYITGRRVVIGLSHLTRGTILEQAQAYAIATAGKPWMLPSEVRADLHMPIDMTLDESGAPAPAMETIAP